MSDQMMYTITVLIWLIIANLRFVLPVSGSINKKDIYKDIAHIFVGMLFGAGFYDINYLILGICLTVIEVIAFIVRKK